MGRAWEAPDPLVVAVRVGETPGGYCYYRAPLGRAWEALWARAEEAFGHRFCKNVIVSFQKPLRGGGD